MRARDTARRSGDGADSSSGGTCLCLPPEDTEPWPCSIPGLGYAETPATQGCPPRHRGRAPELHLGAVSTFPAIIGVINWCGAHARVSDRGRGTGAWPAQPTSTASALHVIPALWGGIRTVPSPSGRPLAQTRWVPVPGGGYRPCLILLPRKGKAAGERLFAELNSSLSTAAQRHRRLPANRSPEHRDRRRGEGLRSVKEGD